MINKKIFYLIVEILVLSALLVVTSKMWSKFDSTLPKIAYSYENESELLLNVENHLTSLLPVEDNNVDEENKVILQISNTNINKKEYQIYFIINSGTLNENYLKIKVDGKSKYLTELEKHTENNQTYYRIKTNQINKQTTNEEDINIYLSSETPDNEQGKKLNINFKVEEI